MVVGNEVVTKAVGRDRGSIGPWSSHHRGLDRDEGSIQSS